MKIKPEEKEKLFRQAKHRLGAPIRKIQLDDEQMDTLLEMATEDYVEYINNWLIEHQWANLIGMDISETDMTRAFVVRGFDMVTQYTYAYSKIVGLGAGEGGYELKKDFVELKKGVQIYEIPAGREINEVLWYTPAALDRAIVDPFIGMYNNSFGGQMAGGMGSFYVTPAFDIMLRAQHVNLKQRLLYSDLTYKITNGPSGKKFLHLMNTPGSKFSFKHGSAVTGRVWYWYYDVNPENKEECLEANKDIIKTPADVPLDNIPFDDLNEPSKVWVRRYFIALCKETLGRVRGTFNGKVPIGDAELEMDFTSLLTEGKDEQMTLKQELNERLAKLNPLEILTRVASEAEQVNKSLQYRAMQKPIRLI
jgi:hypothetical protein